MIVHATGGASNRPGLRFVVPVKDHSNPPRLISFQFNEDDQYILEFGDQYMRVVRDDGYVLEAEFDISVNSNVVSAAGHNYENGDDVFVSDTGTDLDDRIFKIGSVVAGVSFVLLHQVTSEALATSYSASSGKVARIYEIDTPYAVEDLPKLKYVQSADIMTLTHPLYEERELKRFDHDDWRLETINHLPGIDFPRNIDGAAALAAVRDYFAHNGTFTDNTLFPPWNLGPGWTITGGEASCDGSQPAQTYLYVHIGANPSEDELRAGETYTMEYTVTISAGSLFAFVGGRKTDGYSAPPGPTRTISGTYVEELVAGGYGNAGWIASDDFIGTIDNASLIRGTRSDNVEYQVTAIAEGNFEESLPGIVTDTHAISGITLSNPVVVTSVGHGFETGDEIHLEQIQGTTELNGLRFRITELTADTFSLSGADGTDMTAYQSGGIAVRTFLEITGVDIDNLKVTLTWDAVEGAQRYAVYRGANGVFGLIGETETTAFTDTNILPDLTLSPPRFRDPFLGEGNFPAAVGYFQQRRVFGGTLNNPDTSYYSVVGSFSNFSSSIPQQADDAIEATLNALKVNDIRHYVATRDLLIFTGGSEWLVSSGGEAAFEPSTIRQNLQSEWGSAHLPPIVVGKVILFAQENKKIIRSIGYSFESDSFESNDVTILSPHLLKYSDAVEWAYARSSSSIYIVRGDGKAIVFAFNPEQEVVALTPIETQGKFKSVAVIRVTVDD